MITIWVDGSVRNGNPGLAGAAIYAEEDGKFLYKQAQILGDDITNNQAEYMAVLMALIYLQTRNKFYRLTDSRIITDSRLVHGHVVRSWKCNYEHLRMLRDEVRTFMNKLPFIVNLECVTRIDNTIANELAQTITAEEKARRG